MESSDSPRDSGGANSAQGAAQRISLRARLMRRFSVAIGRKKKDGHRSTPSSPPLAERRTIPLMPPAGDSRESASQPPAETDAIENGEANEQTAIPKKVEAENADPQPAFTTNDASAEEAPPKPPKPKPRGSILSRMRRASRTAVELVGSAPPKAASDQNDDDRGEHPKQGGLNAFKKALSGRKLGAAATASGGDKEEPDKVVQAGTVKSLISQTNTKSAANPGKPTGLVAKEKIATPVNTDAKADPAKADVRASTAKGKPVAKVEESISTSARSAGSSASKVKFDESARLSDAKKGPVNRQASSSPAPDEKESGSNSRPLSMALKKHHSFDEKRQSRKSVSKYRSAAEGGLELSPHEQAFMPGDLLKRLGQSAGQLPPAPSVFPGQGAVLFVDVSGFTRLAERLNKENVPVTASQKLAATITRVLEVLAQVCLDCGGEVGKFAGDALLCVWESNDLNKAELLAKHCAVQMLTEMENLNRIEKVDLQIHGGVAKGSIVHFHFGSSDDDLRWYLISGEAVAAATTLVDVANAGEFCCQEGIAKGLPSILDENDVSPRPDGRKGFKISKDVDSGNMFSSFRGISMPKQQKAAIKDDDAPRHTKSLARGKKELPTTFLTSTSDLPPRPNFPPEHSNISAVLKDGLPRSCNVYIPSALRDQLNERSEKKGEMRRRVAAMFVEIGTLVMTEDELLKQTVGDTKLDSLNSAFVTMTRIVHAFEGEVRDMLFDDKGCVYIAIFGAHCEEEKEHHPWNMLAVKAGMAIVNEVPSARIGVSIGTCFVGMAGVIERRTDFVVVGHEVNMSARYMSNARPGQVLVSSGIYSSTKEEIKYGPEIQIMVGKGEYAKQRSVYSPLEESHRRASFQASYRRSMGGGGVFIGRTQEIQAIEANMNKISNGRSGVMVIEAPPGRGKSSIVSRAKRMGRGKIKIVSGQALSTERNTPYFTFRQVLEAYTGIRPSMTSSESRTIIEMIEAGKGEKINIMALALAMPWISESSEQKNKVQGTGKDSITPDRVADTFLQIIRLNFDRSNEKSALIVLEDVHWMDKESLEMLLRLIDGLEKLQKVAILMTFRADEPEKTVNVFEAMEFAAYGDDPEAKTKESQRKELIGTLKSKAHKLKFNSLWIDLPPLPKPDATKFAEKLLGGELNELSAQKMWDQAKGDPFYLELLAQWLVEKSMIRQEKAGTIHVACDPSAFPKTSDELIQNRMSKLTEDQRRVLQLAASGGEVFDAVYVSSVSKALATAESRPGDALSTDAVMAGLNAASDIELVTFITDSVKRDEAQQRWKFKHDLIYRAIWLQILAPRRNMLDRIAATDRKKLALRLKSSFFENPA